MNCKKSAIEVPSGGLRVLGYREYHRYYNQLDRCPLGMVWAESALGIPVEVKFNSLEHKLLNTEKSESYCRPDLDWPISALCLVSEEFFVRERYLEFTEIVTLKPSVGDYLLLPKFMSRKPDLLWTAQATVRYVRAALAARAALKEIEAS